VIQLSIHPSIHPSIHACTLWSHEKVGEKKKRRIELSTRVFKTKKDKGQISKKTKTKKKKKKKKAVQHLPQQHYSPMDRVLTDPSRVVYLLRVETDRKQCGLFPSLHKHINITITVCLGLACSGHQ
jgi:hypothetical protein